MSTHDSVGPKRNEMWNIARRSMRISRERGTESKNSLPGVALITWSCQQIARSSTIKYKNVWDIHKDIVAIVIYMKLTLVNHTCPFFCTRSYSFFSLFVLSTLHRNEKMSNYYSDTNLSVKRQSTRTRMKFNANDLVIKKKQRKKKRNFLLLK